MPWSCLSARPLPSGRRSGPGQVATLPGAQGSVVVGCSGVHSPGNALCSELVGRQSAVQSVAGSMLVRMISIDKVIRSNYRDNLLNDAVIDFSLIVVLIQNILY